MASTITAGNATNGLGVTSDNTGILELKTGTGAGTTAISIDASQIVTGTAGNLMLVSGTAVASTSGTSVDFTGIPSWVKKVTVMFRGVSTNGTNTWLIQLGTGSTPTYATSGYLGSALRLTDATAISGTNRTDGINLPFVSANAVAHGSVTISLIDAATNAWVASGAVGNSNAASMTTTGASITLTGALTAVRITTVGGTDTFDAGTINIMWE